MIEDQRECVSTRPLTLPPGLTDVCTRTGVNFNVLKETSSTSACATHILNIVSSVCLNNQTLFDLILLLYGVFYAFGVEVTSTLDISPVTVTKGMTFVYLDKTYLVSFCLKLLVERDELT